MIEQLPKMLSQTADGAREIHLLKGAHLQGEG